MIRIFCAALLVASASTAHALAVTWVPITHQVSNANTFAVAGGNDTGPTVNSTLTGTGVVFDEAVQD